MRTERKTAKAETAARDLNVEVDGAIRRRLRVYVAQADTKIKAVVNAALDEYLKKRGA